MEREAIIKMKLTRKLRGKGAGIAIIASIDNKTVGFLFNDP